MIDRALIKVLKESAEAERKAQQETQQNIDSLKVRLWDADAMAIVNMERAYTTLNVKVQKMKAAPPLPDQIPNWFYPETNATLNNRLDPARDQKMQQSKINQERLEGLNNEIHGGTETRHSKFGEIKGVTTNKQSTVRLLKSPRARTKSQSHLHSSEAASAATTASGRT